MDNKKTEMSRRAFLKGAAASTAGIAVAGMLGGCSPTEPSAPAAGTPAEEPVTSGKLPWLGPEPQIADSDVEATVNVDVIVVGAGLSGVAATRAASEEGAAIVVFEKASGPQCRSGDFALINGEIQARWGRDNFDTDILVDHEMDEMSYYPKRPILSKWAKGNAEVFSWYIGAKPDLHICPDSFTDIPDSGAKSFLYPWFYPLPKAYDWTKEKHPTYPTSVALGPDQSPVLAANWEKAEGTGKVKPYWGHFVEKLIMDGDRVVGCYARNAETGKYVKATATKGLILASGEYSSNPDILNYYAPAVNRAGVKNMWPNKDVEGNPTNTGDGLKMGAWIDAAIQEHHAPMIHWMGVRGSGTSPYLRLNLEGKRFMNEDMPGQQVENQIEGQPGRKIWQIWDSAWLDQIASFIPGHGSVCYVGKNPKNFVVSGSSGIVNQDDLDAAVEKGQVLKADTIEGLLDLIGELDKKTALASIKRYNELAKAGKDEDFGKVASRMFPLEKGPYYAGSSGVATMLVCCGGLVSDEDCHVYNNEGKIIPGIYVAGNIQGSRYAVQYPIAIKGISHSLCLYYGYVAGKNAVKQI
ncbi:FAD-binding protein [Desulfitobacterium hafniense]|uniref:FAD-binding protein n=1 Tax=Desulfitobacterium hafniense TaxID=49338 RepID=UPI000360BF34|nr:FAD-binding protein [Desulfitobacterium hafniense]